MSALYAVMCGVVVIDGAQDVVRREPSRVDRAAVHPEPGRTRVVAAVAHAGAPSTSSVCGRTPRAQSAAAISRLPAGLTGPSRTARVAVPTTTQIPTAPTS